MQKSPYKFLDSYSKEDRDIFFGRDKEIEELHSRVFESRVLVLYGTSGTGKSSLINCGLANKFNDSDWMPITVRRGTDITGSLFESLGKVALTDASPVSKNHTGNRKPGIVKFIQSVYLDHFKPVFIIFDQFEELFIFGDNEERNELIENVRKVLDSDLQCRFIFSVREEYLAGFTDFERAIPSVLQNRMRIERMTRQNALKVIEGPCKINSIEVEPGFPEALLGKLNPESSEVELTFLQVYLDKIFRIASAGGESVKRINTGLLDEAGEVKDLLGSFLEEQISQLEDPDSGMVVLKSFVSVKGTKNRITEEEVIEYSKTLGKDLGKEMTRELIQKFVNLRILRDKDESGRYELRHDSLATKIYEKITIVEKELLEIRQFLENSYGTFEKRQLYLSSDDLTYIAPYEDKLFLSEKLLRFISESKWTLQRSKRRRQNILISVAAVIISVLSFFTLWALRERSNALDQKHIADEQRVTALKAKEKADSASIAAIAAKNLAVEKENQAVRAQTQAERAEKEALVQRENALKQKKIADEYSVKAVDQARIALEQKEQADREREKAVAAEAEAKRLGLLAQAQNDALKATEDPEKAGLLAIHAFRLHIRNKGDLYDPVIYKALIKTWTTLDSSKHHIFTGSPNEIISIANKGDLILTADYDGIIRAWKNDGTSSEMTGMPVKGPVDFIKFSPSGRYLIYSYESSGWALESIAAENLNNHKKIINSGNLIVAAFSPDENLLASTAGDSLIRIWRIEEANATLLKEIIIPGQVRLLEFYNSDSIVSAYSQKSQWGDLFTLQWNSIADDKFFRDSFNAGIRPLCIAYNKQENNLFVGFSTGSIRTYILKSGNVISSKFYQISPTGIDRFAFSTDGSRVAVTGWDKTLRILECSIYFDPMNKTKKGISQIDGLSGRIRSMIFDGSDLLITAMSDKTLRIWETVPEKLCDRIIQISADMDRESIQEK